MYRVHDLAAYIVATRGPLGAMKLQKLLYYSQAWSLAWDGEPVFRERVQAWSEGPVVRESFDVHRGDYKIAIYPQGDPKALSPRLTGEVAYKFVDAPDLSIAGTDTSFRSSYVGAGLRLKLGS